MIRPFDWRDLPTLHRYRNQGLCLNSALGLTRGETISPSVLLSYLTPTSGVYTWISPDSDQSILGQLSNQEEIPFSRLSFLAPERAAKNNRTLELLDHMSKQAGQQGSLHVLAEVDELAPIYEVLRKAGFGIFARQRIWKVFENEKDRKVIHKWTSVREKHIIAVQSLFQNVVPGLVGQVEPLNINNLQGMVCFKESELLGYVDLKYGHRGIWAQPFIHPDVEEIDDHLLGMIHSIPDRRGRPIYTCVRTYQSWLEPALGEMDSQSSPLQAVMVKRLAVRQKVARHPLPAIEGQTEVSAPMAQSQRNS